MTTTATEPSIDERLLSASIAALDVFGVHLGRRLGLYEALVQAPATPAQLAERAGIHPRYAREWLEQQAVSGYLAVDRDAADDDERRYALPDAFHGALVDAVHPDHVAPLADMVVAVAQTLDEVAVAYRTGGGVPYARYGATFRDGQGAINRPAFSTALVEEWLAGVDGARRVLETGGKVADLGCGQGWSTIAVARAFPEAEVLGVDADAASIEDARRRAAEAGVTARFACADGEALAGHGPFDAVLLLEALHDMSRPVEVLRSVREALTPDGFLLIADEAVAPSFTAPGDELERMMYGWSIVHCLPAAMAEQPSAAIGTVIRESTVRDLAAEAGFGSVRVLDVDGGFFRLYEVRP